MIERIPGTHRYQVTKFGLRVALFFTRLHARLFRPALSEFMPHSRPANSKLRQALKNSTPKSTTGLNRRSSVPKP
jgi:hypothetical protein